MTKVSQISIVDDDESIRESVEGLLKSLGYVVEVFPSAESFLSSGALKKTSPVCVIDDDVSIRDSVAGLLRAEEIPVETYGSAREFLARAKEEPPGCLVLDVELPG